MKKNYFYLNLPEDFFKEKVIKKLRKMQNGDTYVVIYLKMLMLAMTQEGKLYFDRVADTFEEDIALELDEEPGNVAITIEYLRRHGLLYADDCDSYELADWSSIQMNRCKISEEMSDNDHPTMGSDEKSVDCPIVEKNVNNGQYIYNRTISGEINIDSNIHINSILPNEQINGKDNGKLIEKAQELFLHLWSLYPNKKGKAKVTNTAKKRLLQIGVEKLEKALNRYMKYLKENAWLTPQYGSTFFTTGYVDWLDENYEETKSWEKEEKQKKVSESQKVTQNKFYNFTHRNYDFDKIEELLCQKSEKVDSRVPDWAPVEGSLVFI